MSKSVSLDLRNVGLGGLLLLLPLLSGCQTEASVSAASVLPPQGRAFDAPPLVSAEMQIGGVDAPLEKKIGRSPLEEVGAPLAADASEGSGSTSTVKDGIRELSFQELASFEYETVDPLSMLQKGGPPPKTDIPAKIEAYSGERVKVDGFLMPTIFESGKVQQFLLTRSYITCCFGDVLNMNEVIDVTVGPDLEVSYFLSGQPVTVTGWLEVGEKKSEFGYVESIYRLVAEEVVERW